MANLTMDLFGETVNVVEVETRLEGLEHLVEAVFGPAGPVSASTVNGHIERAMRVIRSTVTSDEIVDEYKDIPNVIDNNFKVPKVS